MVVKVRTFVMTDTSFSEAERESDGDASEVGEGRSSVGEDGAFCLRKRAAAATVVSVVVVMTCSMVDVTVEAWNCVAVADPWVRYTGVNPAERKRR